jgi:hypothetical protein
MLTLDHNQMPNGNKLGLKGSWHVQLERDGKIILDKVFPNGITNEGKNTILDVMFHGTAATATWYLGLISNTGYSALAAADTMGSHAGWTEFTGYSEGTRQEWTEDAAASQAITNSTPVTFNINAGGTLKGGFLTSGSAKSGTTGILWGTALFNADIPVLNGDVLRVTYTVTTSG